MHSNDNLKIIFLFFIQHPSAHELEIGIYSSFLVDSLIEYLFNLTNPMGVPSMEFKELGKWTTRGFPINSMNKTSKIDEWNLNIVTKSIKYDLQSSFAKTHI